MIHCLERPRAISDGGYTTFTRGMSQKRMILTRLPLPSAALPFRRETAARFRDAIGTGTEGGPADY